MTIMILPILIGEDQPVLRQKAAAVQSVTGDLRKLAKNMAATMEKAKGLGLAAPQIAVSRRLIIVRLNSGDKSELIVPMFNPQILEFSRETEVREEGCLSLPELFLKVKRPVAIKLRFIDMRGETQILKLAGMNARVVQHEVDHLEGILITDRALEIDTQPA